MIHALTCLLFPLVGGCAPFVDYGASPSDLINNPAYFATRAVVVTGKLHGYKQLRGASFGTPAEIFTLCDRRCVTVFIREHSGMFEGERVSVRGTFVRHDRFGKVALRNAVEATEVLPRI